MTAETIAAAPAQHPKLRRMILQKQVSGFIIRSTALANRKLPICHTRGPTTESVSPKRKEWHRHRQRYETCKMTLRSV